MYFNLEKITILIVEDLPQMQQLISSVLRQFGARRVMYADDGQQGLNMARSKRPDLILTDWIMPEMDGLEMTRRIRSDIGMSDRTVPIIVMTGFSSEERVKNARDAGITEFIVKPFNAKDLATRIAYTIAYPRNFIDSRTFKGPDRRRRVDPKFKGPYKRETDMHDTPKEAES